MQERSLRNVVYLGAGLGLLISLFAAAEFFDTSLRAVCSVNSFLSCGTVDTSGFTTTLGIPDYVWGTGGFVLILIIASIAEQRSTDPRPAFALLFVTTLGIGFALYFLYVELAEIHALCLVCAAAYVMGVVAWVGAIGLARSPTLTAGGNDDRPGAARNDEGAE
jgi:uncharacterized membrane protein